MPVAGLPLSPRRLVRLSVRVTLATIAAAAGVWLLVLAAKASDILHIGSRPDASDFRDFLISAAIGVPLGAAAAFYSRSLYRRHRGFFVEWYATPAAQLGWRLKRWNLLFLVPFVVGIEILIAGAFRFELSPYPALLAAMLWAPLVGPELKEILRSAAELKSARERPEDQRPSVPAWSHETPTRRYVERFVFSVFCVAAVGFTGYTVNLQRIAETEEAARILRPLFIHPGADFDRFYDLTHEARKAARTCDETRLQKGEADARTLLTVYPEFEHDWNYGNAIHYGNLALGRVALRHGNTGAAKRYLLRAAETPGSPQLGDYGPDMTLARELLEHGETATVRSYLRLCGRFWRNEKRNCVLEEWAGEIDQSHVPDFGTWAGPVPRLADGWTCDLLETTVPVK
ncbi:MAG: hypothetical protein ABI682_04020 [Acidobacteriota bacterium]